MSNAEHWQQSSAVSGTDDGATTIARHGIWSLYRVKGTVSAHGHGESDHQAALYNHLEIAGAVFNQVFVSSELERTIRPGTSGIFYVAVGKIFGKKFSTLLAFRDRNNEIIAPLKRRMRTPVFFMFLIGVLMLLFSITPIVLLIFPPFLGLLCLFLGVRLRIGIGGIDRTAADDLRDISSGRCPVSLEGVGAIARSV